MAETRYVRSGDAHIAYQVVGSGDLDIVLVPGWFSHVEIAWDVPGLARFLRGLADIGRVILFDKRGTGMSDRVPPDQLPTFEERTEDILAVMDAAGSEQAALVGLSEGGTQSILAAVRHPDRVRAVVMIGSWARMLEADGFPIGVSRERLDATLAGILANWGSGDDIRLFLPSRKDDEQVRTAWATLERRAASPGAVETYGRMLFEMDVRDVLADVAVPTLVVHAAGDRVVPIAQGRFLADHVPNARFVELASDDHLPWFDQVETTLAEVESFLTGRVQPHHVERTLAAILITDIVGSTDQAASEGDRRWRDRLDAYDALAHRIVERHGGRVVKSTGDGTLARFDDPHAAVRAARSLEDEVVPVGVRIRAGVHCGQVEVRGDDLGGIAVHIAARVGDHCPAGAVLVSQTVRDLLLGSDLDLQPHGEAVELRGVPGAWQLYAVDGPARAR